MDQIQPSESPTPPENLLPPQTAAPVPMRLTESDERTWAMLAHLSILLNLITGFLGIVVALIIYLVYKNRSNYVAYQSMQSFVFQLIWWFGGGLLIGLVWAITGALSLVLVGLVLVPLACVLSLIPLASLVYGIIGAVQTNSGQDFKYWLIGDWVRGELTRS
jgi:uncharacterized Tic20 family protein